MVVRRVVIFSLISIVLILSGCSAFSAPTIELVEIPSLAQARTDMKIVWQVTPPAGFVSANQFTLHLDTLSHATLSMRGRTPDRSGYTEMIEAEPQMLEDGSIRLEYTVYELRPTLLYYRFHVNIDGHHYWTPEGVLSIQHKPAFEDTFKEHYLDESLSRLQLLK